MTEVGAIIFWLIAAIFFIIIEGVTAQLVSVWFVIGTIPALLIAVFGGSFVAQGIVFLATSVIVLIIGRPITKKKLNLDPKATNADRVIGMTGVTYEEINNLKETGRVLANGLEWTARTEEDDLIIAENTKITVLRIEGVKLIVQPLVKESKREKKAKDTTETKEE